MSITTVFCYYYTTTTACKLRNLRERLNCEAFSQFIVQFVVKQFIVQVFAPISKFVLNIC